MNARWPVVVYVTVSYDLGYFMSLFDRRQFGDDITREVGNDIKQRSVVGSVSVEDVYLGFNSGHIVGISVFVPVN